MGTLGYVGLGFLVLVIVLVVWGMVNNRKWPDNRIDEAEMLDAELERSEMDKEGWSREKRKIQCRKDIESKWRRVPQARYLYGNEIVDEVAAEMKQKA